MNFVCLMFVLSCLCAPLCNAHEKKSHYIPKNALCAQNSEVCKDEKYDFLAIVWKVVQSFNKLSMKRKGLAENGGACSNALKKAICSDGKSPLCFSGNDDSGVEKVCDHFIRNCTLIDSSFMNQCVTMVQEMSINLTCAANDEKVEGYCPKPDGKMPMAYWKAYTAKSKALENPMKVLEGINTMSGGSNLISSDCMEKIKNTVCVPLHCSADEKKVMVPNMQHKCNEVLGCINQASDRYEKLSSVLKPIKDSLSDGCDKLVEAVRSSRRSGSQSGARNDAQRISRGPQLVLIICAILMMYFTY